MLFYDMNLYVIMIIVEFLIFVFMSGFVTGQLYTEYKIDSQTRLNIPENIKDIIIDSQTSEIDKLKKDLEFTHRQIESFQYGTNENVILHPYKNH